MPSIVDELTVKYDGKRFRPARHINTGELCDGRHTLEYNVFLDGVAVTADCVCADERGGFVVMLRRNADGGFVTNEELHMVELDFKRGNVEILHQSEAAPE